MPGETFDMFDMPTDDTSVAQEIGRMYTKWQMQQHPYQEVLKELRDQLYAIDIATTANAANDFANRTTVPKLMHIYQNLAANYQDHLFSSPEWLAWEAHDEESAKQEKRRSIQSYIRSKYDQQDIETTYGKLLLDWLFGTCVCQLVYKDESKKEETTGDTIPGYLGPQLIRIPPTDIVYNLAAPSFYETPKILRELISIGELHKRVEDRPDEQGWTKKLIDSIRGRRERFANLGWKIGKADQDKAQGFIADGFNSIQDYYQSDLVEVLTFKGDFYDSNEQKLLRNYTIVVADRFDLLLKEQIKSWNGSDYLYQATWQDRPDNLMGMGPLENLCGMQYKLDKLENLRADVFDQIVHPVTVERGDVEFYGTRGAPGGHYIVGEDGSVDFLRPDTTALQADNQILQTMRLMEELAGSPRESMGQRTPGEKTKFEVQVLEQGANRLFRNKTKRFEKMIERIANDSLELARRKLDGPDLVRAETNEFGAEEFLEITKEDLKAVGHLRARGSTIFIERANKLQDLNTIFSSPIGQLLNPHTSRIKLSEVVAQLAQVEKDDIFMPNIGITEDAESRRIAQTAQQSVDEESQLDIDDQTNEEGPEQEAQ